MKYRVSDLEGALLDAAVAKAEGYTFDIGADDGNPKLMVCYVRAPMMVQLNDSAAYDPSVEWFYGGPIIERERIATYFEAGGYPKPCWVAGFDLRTEDGEFGGSDVTAADPAQLALDHSKSGDTPLIAAMRAYVASKLGEEVDLP